VGDIVLARGARGDLVMRVQRRLIELGFDTRGVDGTFGGDTETALKAFQAAGRLGVDGGVDADTWQALMGIPIPGVRDRALQVTAAFEGHGFTLAQGNYDGAGLTWGIIGFTIKSGEVSKLLLELERRAPAVVEQAFGTKKDELLDIMASSRAKQIAWADALSLGSKKVRLAEPWRSAFGTLGETDEAQALQLEVVSRDYFEPARRTATELGLNTELGVALAFDIHVQNGGIGKAARETIASEQAKHPIVLGEEQVIRVIVANAVADSAKPEYREDVRTRKLTLATGSGRVHGAFFVLRNWGLDETPFTA
jgi:hypothetical protein